MKWFHTLALILLGWHTASAQTNLPPTRGEVINIVEWDGGQLPRVYERSSQLPFTSEDLVRLAQSDFSPQQIAQMVVERRFIGDASATGLIALKNNGVATEVIQAVSKHALPPNRALNLTIHLDFEGESWAARKRYLYIIVPDGDIERVFKADLGAVLSGKWQHDVVVDHTDPLLARKIRRVTFSGIVPLKTHGQKTVRIFTSAHPGIHRLSEVPKVDLSSIKTHTIDYPVSSLLQDCRVIVRYKQDAMLTDKWHLIDTHLECEWN